MTTFLDIERVKLAFTNWNDDDTVLQSLTDGCVAMVQKYCNQNFTLTTYNEQVDTNELCYFQLAQRPVVNIIRVANVAPVLQIQNTTAQRATISIDATGVTLTSATNGAVSTQTIYFETFTTMSALATAISLVSGWTCSVVNSMGSHESSLLARVMGVPCLNIVQLDAFTRDIQWAFQAPATVIVPQWVGIATTRVDYVAGYSTCPDDLAMAISELVQLAYAQRQINPTLVSYSNGAYSWTKVIGKGFEQLSAPSRKALAKYKLPRISGAFIV